MMIFKLFFIISLLSAVRTYTLDQDFMLSDDNIDMINSMNLTWKAKRNFPPGTTMESVKRLLGVPTIAASDLPLKPFVNMSEPYIPEAFDSRKKWPLCRSLFHIIDQGHCGSCWACATAAAISDRICIHSYQRNQTIVSIEDILSCIMNDDGCGGGWTDDAWQYWVTDGVVTGGDYNSREGCWPYEIEPVSSSTIGTPSPDTPSCGKKCRPGYAKQYSEDKQFGLKAYGVIGTERQIQLEIMEFGPVTASMAIYSQFISYHSGIYQITPGDSILGYHAVKIIGWGVESGLKYWLIANSWGNSFGEYGLFRIVRGVNECSIEAGISGGIPRST